ncbi:THO complex subunit 6-like [Selaginella moellendorffii]|uniref:THO complex subunit 6-like n=1 Tax=Selaginella moellendorffii TaxID=88036 RepID=UPI000D1CC3CC|nr:THO complex subunit 6-like [Selaginella moellendorffii]|eukprot:XP_024534687.1 THO complex subunit 6-like [Selaginella moellendorffii]
MGDARGWRRDDFKASVLAERCLRTRIVFALRFPPTLELAPPPPRFLAAATSDGSVGIHPICRSPPISGIAETTDELAKPWLSLAGHDGPAYGLLSFGEDGNKVLASCGDDGRIAIWRWNDVLERLGSDSSSDMQERPVLEMKIPQQRGQHGSLLPVAEANGLAADAGTLFCAAGDGCAYGWDLETGQGSMVFQGHAGYLHCIASRPSQKQLITGSEDGTCRIWDCRSGRCTAVLDPWNVQRVARAKSRLPWVSCVAVDASENWMACGTGGGCVTLWNLPMVAAATRITTAGAPQDVAFTTDEIVVVGVQPHLSRFTFGGKLSSQVACAPLSSFAVSLHPSGVTAVGGHGGMVDVISSYGSHLCTFSC